MLYLGRLNHPFFFTISLNLYTVRKTTSHKTNACKLSDWSQGTVEAVQTGRVQELDANPTFSPTTDWVCPRMAYPLRPRVATPRCFISKSLNQTGHTMARQVVRWPGCWLLYGVIVNGKWAKLKTLSWSIRHDLHSLDIRRNDMTSSNLIIQMPSFESKTDILISYSLVAETPIVHDGWWLNHVKSPYNLH